MCIKKKLSKFFVLVVLFFQALGLVGCRDQEAVPGKCTQEFEDSYNKVKYIHEYTWDEEGNSSEDAVKSLKAVFDRYTGLKEELETLEQKSPCILSVYYSSVTDPKTDTYLKSAKSGIESKILAYSSRLSFATALVNLKKQTGIKFRAYNVYGLNRQNLENLFDLEVLQNAEVNATVQQAYDGVTQFQAELQRIDREFPQFRTSYRAQNFVAYLQRAGDFLVILDAIRPVPGGFFREFVYAEPDRRRAQEQDEYAQARRAREAAQAADRQHEAQQDGVRRQEEARAQELNFNRAREALERGGALESAMDYINLLPRLRPAFNLGLKRQWIELLSHRASQDRFFALHPTLEEVRSLIERLGVDTLPQLELVLTIKQRALQDRAIVGNAGGFIQLLDEVLQNAFAEYPVYKERTLQILHSPNTLRTFWNFNPTLEQVMSLIGQIGVASRRDVDLVIELKRSALLDKNLVHTGVQYYALFNEIVERGFIASPLYLERNCVLILSTYENFMSRRQQLTRQDLDHLRRLILSPAIPFAYQQQARDYVTRLLNSRIEALPVQMRALVLNQVQERVRALYDQVRPRIDEGAFEYYLIRPEVLRAHLARNRVTQGVSLITGEVLSEENHGTQCHQHLDGSHEVVPYIVPNSAPQGQPSNSELYGHVRAVMGEGVFPIHCGAGERNRHELPLNVAMLENAGFNRTEIYDWQIGTLLSYYHELLRIQRGRLPIAENGRGVAAEVAAIPPCQICSTGDCGTPLFADQRNPENQHIRCNVCDQQRCYLCDRVHLGMTCEQAVANNYRPDYFDPAGNLRPCPYCGVPAAKDDACNSVRCAVCLNEWHFVKGAPREGTPFFELHSFNHGGVVPVRQYRVEGEMGYVEGRESAFPEVQGAIRNQHRVRRDANRYRP